MYDAPTVTAQHVLELLTAQSENPVLYIKCGPDDEGGEPELEVWDEALVHHYQIVLTREAAVDWFGEEVGPGDIEDFLPELQDSVDQVYEGLVE